MSVTLQKAFELLKEKNYPLIAVKGKKALGSGWSKNPIESLPDYASGFGLLCGEMSGVVALDIDALDSELKDKIKNIVNRYRETFVSGRVGNPDKVPALFYRMTEATKKKITLNNINVEILSSGQQIVLPPSLHPTTNQSYQWVLTPLDQIDVTNLCPFPDKLLEELIALNNEHAKNESTFEKIDITKGVGRCNHGSHNHLSKLGVALMHQGESPDEIVRKLLEEDTRINESISYFVCPSRPEWKILNRELNAVNFVNEMLNQNFKAGKIQSVNLMGSLLEFGEIERTTSATPKKIKYKKIPPLTGFAADIFDYIYETSPKKRAQFSFASTITLISTLISGKCTLHGFHPRTYSMVIAHSGGGKNYPTQCIYSLLAEAGLTKYIGPADLVSEAGFLLEMVHHNVKIFRIDESHKIFRDKGTGSKLAGIGDLLAEFYTLDDYYAGKRLAGYKKGEQKIGEVHNPQANAMFLTTHSAFSSGKYFDSEFFTTGLGARFFMYFDDRQRKGRLVPPYCDKKKAKVIEGLQVLAAEIRSTATPDAPLTIDKPIPLEMEPEAKAKLIKIMDEFSDLEAEKEAEESIRAACSSRKVENLAKLIMVFHASSDISNYLYTPVKLETVDKALGAINSILHNQLINLEHYVADSEFEVQLNKVKSYIRERGEVTLTLLSQNFRKIHRTKRHDILMELQSTQDVKLGKGLVTYIGKD